MCFDDALVTASKRGNGHGLGRRQREIVKHAPVCGIFFIPIVIQFAPESLSALRQRFAGLRMVILTQRDEFIAPDITAQSECFSAFAEPLAANPLPFAVIVSGAKMLLKILLSILQIVLRLR